jgi:SHS family lactate transporter-like MFS transporter
MLRNRGAAGGDRSGIPNKGQLISFTAAWVGWVMDAFDFTVFLLVMPHIEKEFGVKHTASTGAIALTLLMRLVGGFIAGKAADRWGRKLPLLVSVVWFALCDGAISMAPTFTAIIVLRTLFGLGMGAEWTSGTTLAMENWPEKSKGLASGILQGSWAVGYLLAAVASALIVPRFGWRALFVVTALPALLVLPLRAWVPESKEWKNAVAARGKNVGLLELFRKNEGLLGRTLWGCLAMGAGFGAYYALTGLYPTMLKLEHAQDERGIAVLVMLFNVGMMLGSFVCGGLAAKKSVALALALPAALSVFALPFYVGQVEGHMSAGAFFGGAFGAGFCGVTPMLLTSMFPAEGRARLVGIVYHVGAFFAGFVPLLTASLSQSLHWSLGKSILVVSTALEIALVVLVIGRRKQAHGAEAEGETRTTSSKPALDAT